MDVQNTVNPAMRCRPADMSPQELGARGESRVADNLSLRGWEVTERNWTCPFGEADIIAYDGDTCVFVEVKTRLVPSFETRVYPEEAVDSQKIERYERMARFYMAQKGIDYVRFDVVGVSVIPEGMAHIHHVRDLFGCGV